MIAYRKSSLEAIRLSERVKIWKNNNLISLESSEKINAAYSNDLYTPNLFIRIALFVFACILTGAVLGLLTMFSYSGDSEDGFAVRLIIYGVLVFVALESVISQKKAYKAGIDDSLLYIAISLLLSGGCILFINSVTGEWEAFVSCVFMLPVLIAASIRYADMLLSFAAFCCLFACVFFLLIINENLTHVLPFAGMILSTGVYYVSLKLYTKENLAWWNNIIVLEFCSLLAFYLSGNYFVVRELSIELLDIHLKEGEDIPFAFIFYFFTSAVPLIYLGWSIKKKDRVMLRCGLLLVALAVLTFKYYYSLGHHELTITLAGVIMVSLAWACMNFLKSPRFGLTSEKDTTLIDSDLEAVIIEESFGKTVGPQKGIDFGGGQSGGAGAAGKY